LNSDYSDTLLAGNKRFSLNSRLSRKTIPS
jgi:hypothetical protein